MEITEISKEEFNSLSLSHELANFYQTYEYGVLMSKFNFNAEYIKIVENNKIVAVSLILSKSIYLGFKYGYAPRGILMDYSNTELVSKISKTLKSYLIKKGYMILKIDPLVIRSLRNKKGEIVQYNNSFDLIMSNLKKADFTHCGFNSYMESVKPRWHAIINIKNKDLKELFFSLSKNTRNKLRKASKFGIEIFKDKNTDIEQIYSFIKGKGNYSLEYYNEFKKLFKDSFEIYLARINTETYVKNSSILFEREQQKNDQVNSLIQSGKLKGKNIRKILNKKMESDKLLNIYKNHLIKATTLLKNYPNGLIVGGQIVIRYNNKLYLLIDGFSEEFQALCPAYISKWKIIEKFYNENIDYFDINAITGDFSEKNKLKGLNEVKLGFNAKAVEFAGEFNLIINKVMYSLYRSTADKYNIKNQKK